MKKYFQTFLNTYGLKEETETERETINEILNQVAIIEESAGLPWETCLEPTFRTLFLFLGILNPLKSTHHRCPKKIL